MKYTDKELIDWLEERYGYGLINDDNGHWAVSGSGFQNVASGGDPEDIQTTFLVFKDEWRDSIREAIIAAIDDEESSNQEEIDFEEESLEVENESLTQEDMDILENDIINDEY
jgi:hypothetical protein